MEPTYRIAKWKETFEKSDAKRIAALSWISLPTSFASNGYQSLLDEFGDDAPAMYGAWCALACFASTCPVRGTLASGRHEPIPLHRIARVTGFPPPIFERLFAWATRPEIGWLELVPPTDEPREPPGPHPAAVRTAAAKEPAAPSVGHPDEARAASGPESVSPPQSDPDTSRAASVLQTGQTEHNKQDTTNERTNENACVRACEEENFYEPIVLTLDRWDEATPLMQRIAKTVDPDFRDRNGGRLRAPDRELCWRVAALSLWHFSDDQWLETVLASFADRREPLPIGKRWSYFRGAMIKAAKARGEDFHAIEQRVRLSPEVADREAAKVAKPSRAAAPVTA